MADHDCYKLTPLINELSKHPDTTGIAGLIKRVQDAFSADFDLLFAQRKLALAGQIFLATGAGPDNPAVPDDTASIIGSLIDHALVLYMRATTTKSDHRGTSPVTKGWPTFRLAAHERLKTLRNDAIAHFGHAESHLDGEWASDDLYLVMNDQGTFSVRFRPRRVNYRQNTSRDLHDCVEAARTAMDGIIGVRLEKLFTALHALFSSYPSRFEDLIMRYPALDPHLSLTPEQRSAVWHDMIVRTTSEIAMPRKDDDL